MLLVLIVFIISVRFFIPEKNISIRNIPTDFKEDPGISVMSDTFRLRGDEVKRQGGQYGSQAVRKKETMNVDINRCDTSDLIKLPGIGPVLSVRIIKYRNLLGGFVRTEQLREVYGLPAETYERIKDQIYVDTLIVSTININSADYKALIRFPYFEKHEVTAILKYRGYAGRIKDVAELVDNKLITAETALKVRPYLRFE